MYLKYFSLLTLLLSLFNVTADSAKTSYELALAHSKIDLETSIIKAQESLEIAKKSNNIYYQAKSLFLIGWSNKRLQRYPESAESYLNCFSLLHDTDDILTKKVLISALKNLSFIMNDFQNHRFQRQILKEAILLSKEVADTTKMMNLYGALINSYNLTNEFDESQKLANEVFSNYSSAYDNAEFLSYNAQIKYHLDFFDEAAEEYSRILEKPNLTHKDKIIPTHYLARSLFYSGKIEQSWKYFNASMNFSKLIGDKTYILFNHYMMANVLKSQNKFEESISHYLLGIHIFEETTQAPVEWISIYEDVSDAYELKGDLLNAIKYQSLYTQKLKDYIINQEQLNNQYNEMNMQIFQEKFRDILANNGEKQNIISIADYSTALILILLLVAFGTYYYRITKRNTDIINDLKKIDIESNV